MSIHPSSIISKDAKIGANVTVGPYAIIGPEVELGDHCYIYPHSVLEYVSLGQHCTVFPHASIGLPPQHLKYNNEPTRVLVGNNCTFRENVTVHRGTVLDQGKTIIGDNGYFMALSHIAHDCVLGNNVIMANSAQLAGHVKIGDNCFISTSVGIHQFVRIGRGALVSGGAMVPLDVAPYCIAQGDRAIIRGLNLVGMRRMGMDKASIKLIKEAYSAVFSSGLNLNQALGHPVFSQNNSYLNIFKSFFLEPKRGYARPGNRKLPSGAGEEVFN